MEWIPATLYRRTGDRFQCDVCPFRCTVAEGQTGACRVRRGGPHGMETATFATSVQHVDAVERKPLYHYRPGSRTVTLAAPGCSLRCDYCVNHQLSQFGREAEVPWTGQPVSPEAVVHRAQRLGACVALSYSEPSLAIELTLALAEAGAPLGVDVVWKSNGFLTTDAVRRVAPVLAAVNVDLKSVDDTRHRALTGAPVGPVLDTLEALRAAGVWVEASTPLVPGVADSPEDLSMIAERLARIDPGIPWHLARFSPAFRRTTDVPTLPSALAEGVAAGRAAGLRHIYVERALGAAGRATSCHGCGSPVVERGLWELTGNRILDGACPDCGTQMEGRW